MRGLRYVPAVLSSLVLGAHFLRWGSIVLAAICVLAPIAFFLPSRAAKLASRGFLLAGAGIWVWVALGFARERMAEGRPYLRMALILGAVAALAAWSAWILPAKREVRTSPPR